MGICRDCFGKLSYTATNSDKAVFSVTRGRNEIMHCQRVFSHDVAHLHGLDVGVLHQHTAQVAVGDYAYQLAVFDNCGGAEHFF